MAADAMALTVSDVRRLIRAALAELGRAREEIDALNVFPVADSDTGTNLYLTVEAATQAVADLGPGHDLGECVRTLTRAALVDARGNSGVILSQMLRGAGESVLAAVADPPAGGSAQVCRDALARAAALAYGAVVQPVEGTMLTVLRAAAAAAADTQGDLATTAAAAATAARAALERTPLQLEALARAGVVDAGGRGITVLLDVLAGAASGMTRMSPPPRGKVPVPERITHRAAAGVSPTFELTFLFDAVDADIAGLRTDLAPLGESLVVVGGEGLFNVHLHTDDVGPAIEAALRIGRPHRIRVVSLVGSAMPGDHAPDGPGRVVVALAPGPGLAKVLADAGAVVVEVRSGVPPSTMMLLDALCTPGIRQVVVLPHDEESRHACEAAAGQARARGVGVAVVPTVAPAQALAALAVHDRGRRYGEDVVEMTAAAGATRHGEILLAGEDAMTSVGVCRAGDVLGLIGAEVVVIGTDLEAVGAEVVDRLLQGGGEMVTLIAGADLPPEAVPRLAARLHHARPDVECVTYDGGQQDVPLLVGVE